MSRTKVHKRNLHVRILLHPLYMFGILCCGVFISAYTVFAGADSYQVTAVVAAPLPKTPAIILFPIDNAAIITAPLQVTGTCALGSYVKLSRGGEFSGVAQCSPTGTFTISTDLATGNNVLQAQDYNQTNQPGPASAPVTVTYKPDTKPVKGIIAAANAPLPALVGSVNNFNASKAYGPLRLTSDYAYQVHTNGAAYSWGLDLRGGNPPYRVTAVWDDGQSSQYYFSEDPAFTISHSYKNAGIYNVLVDSTDARGYRVQMQLSAVIRDIHTGAIVSQLSGQQPTRPASHAISTTNLLRILWPSYFIVLLMSVSFWLGQHRELEILRREARRLHRRRPA